jgi:hypothetical protein
MYQRWTLVLFCTFVLLSVKPKKKECKSVKKKEFEKSKSVKCGKKSANSAKPLGRGKNKDLE